MPIVGIKGTQILVPSKGTCKKESQRALPLSIWAWMGKWAEGQGDKETDPNGHGEPLSKGSRQLKLYLLENGTLGGFSGGLLTSRVRSH